MSETGQISIKPICSLKKMSGFFEPPQDSLATKATPQSEYDQVFIEYTSKPAYRNVINLAAWQFDTMIEQYRELTELGYLIIEEIDATTAD